MKLDELRYMLERSGRLTLIYPDPKTKRFVFYRAVLVDDRIYEYSNYIDLGPSAPMIVAEAEAAKSKLRAEVLKREGDLGPGRAGWGWEDIPS